MTAFVALVVDQMLWLRFPLSFGPGILIAFLAPVVVGGIGISIGRRVASGEDRRLGIAIVITNLLAVVLGLWWALELQPQAFGGPGISPAFLPLAKPPFIVR